MDDLARLQDRLSTLAKVEVVLGSFGRRIVPKDGQSIPDAFRTEVAETHLARKLTFRSNHGAELILVIKAGRILSLGEDGTVPTAQDVQAAVTALLTSATTLEVKSALAPPILPGMGNGIPLPDPFDASQNTDAPSLQTLLDQTQHVVRAAVFAKGGAIIAASGQQKDTDALSKIIEGEIAETAPNAALPASCVIFGGGDGTGHHLFCGRQANDLLAMTFPDSALNDILLSWQTFRHGARNAA